MKPVVEPLAKFLNKEVHFLNDCVGKETIEVIQLIKIRQLKKVMEERYFCWKT